MNEWKGAGMSIKVISPGLLCTIQDAGRHQYKKDGIITSGAMDLDACKIANLLTGNNMEEACLEICMKGPELYFENSYLIALSGADLSPMLDGVAVKMWRPIWVPKGSTLSFGAPRSGCFTYLAVAGGFNIPKVLESYSTYLAARFGGYKGRALMKNDVLECNTAKEILPLLNSIYRLGSGNHVVEAHWAPDPQLLPAYDENPVIRFIRGPEWQLFSKASQDALLNEPFKVSARSNRMGYQLQGPELSLSRPAEILSSAVTFGTVQVPGSGNPIILTADHQTTGGYPRIANVISADFSPLVQTQAGKNIYFKETTLADAHQLLSEQGNKLELLRMAIHLKLNQPV
ncbi:biotin-dependent carboxyltransferase family protein [Cesiribacter sp. SM1]|uniref:5-oxoprolinase subunit C family protein n=1 Tax=Cesiribacter sp. SM1 TaxID=2861196 RepID=UPI001CD2EE62|nr:biotin-dependent carboxyltransferase family protein [Cesiribacter sp. SM1]